MLSVFFAVVFQFRWVKYMDKSSTGFYLGSNHFKIVFSSFFLRQQLFQGCLISAFSGVIQKLFGERNISFVVVVVEVVWFGDRGISRGHVEVSGKGRWLEGRGRGGWWWRCLGRVDV